MHDNKYEATVIPHAVHEFPDDCRAQAETYRKYCKEIKAVNLMFIGRCIILIVEYRVSRKLLRMDVLASETC